MSDFHIHRDFQQKEINKSLIFILLMILVGVFFIMDIFLGSVSLKPSEVLNSIFHHGTSQVDIILYKFRFPKAITALLVGVALSLSGLQMQTLFRNPMAGPYVLGVSSGASLGVALVILGFSAGITTGNLQALGNWVIVLSAWLGAMAVMFLIMFISSRIQDIFVILIIGLMLSGAISAVVTIMQYFSSESMLKTYIIWTMGSLGNLTSSQLSVLMISVGIGIILSLASIKMLNAFLLGESYAMSIGLNIKAARMIIFACTSILAGSVTAFCGPIGFIGIAVPHIARNLFRTSDHRILLPASMLAGAIVMLASDIISQLPGSGNLLPINSITSLIGIPVVLWVIIRSGKKSAWND
jgi:iron complex transport system permease protein